MAWSMVGFTVFAVTNWGMQIVLAKLGGAAQLGTYALGVAVTTPAITLAQMNMRGVMVSDVARKHPFLDYFVARLLAVSAALVFFGGIGFGGAYEAAAAWVIFLTGIGVCVDSVSDVCYGLMQSRERMRWIGISMAAKGILSITLLGGVFAATRDIVAAVGGSITASFLVAFLFDVRLTNRLLREEGAAPLGPDLRWIGRASWSSVAVIFLTSLPLGVTLWLNSLSANLPRYYLERSFGAADLGIFSALAALIVVGRTVVNALGQAAHPRLAKLYRAADYGGFRRLSLQLLGIGALLAVAAPLVAALIGPPLLRFIYTAEYAAHNDLFILILAAGGLTYVSSFIGYCITSAGYLKVQVAWAIAVLVAALVASAYFIPQEGLVGAAKTLLVSGVVQLGFAFVVLAVVYRAHPERVPAPSPQGAEQP